MQTSIGYTLTLLKYKAIHEQQQNEAEYSKTTRVSKTPPPELVPLLGHTGHGH